MKKLKKILTTTFVVLCLLFLSRNLLVKNFIKIVGGHTIGSKITIEKLNWNIFLNKITIKKLNIRNPPGFPDEILLEIHLIEMRYKLSELLDREPHISLVNMDIKEFIVVKNKEGKLNVNELNLTNIENAINAKTFYSPSIDLLKLNMSLVVHKDYSKGDKAIVKTYDIGLQNKEFKNIKSPQKLLAVVLFNALKKTSIKGVKMYALVAFLGPTSIPVGITGMLIGKDHASSEYDVPMDRAYPAALRVLENIGKDVSGDEQTKMIKAVISGHNVSVKMESISESKVIMTSSARKLKIPKPNFAGGILYQIGKEISDQ